MELDISKIKENPNNPRLITEESVEVLKHSLSQLQTMGELKPIILDKNKVVLAGNQRLRAYKELGRKSVPVAIFTQKLYNREVKQRIEQGTYNDETYEDICKEIMIKDNVNVGTWDWEMLHTDYEEEQLMEYGLETFGVNDDFDPDQFFEKKVEFNAKDEHHFTLTYTQEKFDKINAKLQEIETSPEELFYNHIINL